MSTTEELQRLRRIETRITQFMVAMGVDVVGAQKPQFKQINNAFGARGVVIAPSMHTSMKELLDCIPKTWGDAPVDIMLGDQLIAHIRKRC